MRIFIKHILRTIKKSPLQPLLILLTLTIAVATLLCSVKVLIQLDREQKYEFSTAHNYDLNVSVAAESDIRILITEEIQRIIGSGGVAIGEFYVKATAAELPMDELFGLCATDLYQADRFYDFHFTEYGEIRESTVKNAIILSSHAASLLHLTVGDTLSLKILNRSFQFEIAAIAMPSGPLFENHGIIDISAVMDALKSANPAIAHMADNFQPANSIKVRLTDPNSAPQYREAILNSPHLSHAKVSIEADLAIREHFKYEVWLLLTALVIFIVVLIAIIIITTSQNMLAAERRNDTALFLICGASPKQLQKTVYLEAMLYALLSMGLGILFSFPIRAYFNTVFQWKYTAMTFEPLDILIALLSAPAITIISVAIRQKHTAFSTVSALLNEGYEHKHIQNRTAATVWGALALLSLTVAFCLPPKHRYIPALLAVVFVILFAYFIIPRLVSLLCALLCGLMQKLKRIPAKSYLSLRKIGSSYSLTHSIRIICVVMALLIALSVYPMRGQKEISVIQNVLDCTYVVSNTNRENDEFIASREVVKNSFRAKIIGSTTSEEGDALLSISVEEKGYSLLHEALCPKQVVGLGEIAISQGIAAKYRKSVGDTFTVLNKSESYTLTVCEILNISANVTVLDAKSIDETNDMVCVQTKTGASIDDIGQLSSELEARGFALTAFSAITTPIVSDISSFVSLMRTVILFAVICTLVGVVNVVMAAWKKKGRERKLYFTVGMTKSDIAWSAVHDVLFMILLSALIIPLLSTAMLSLTNMAANAFGFDVIF